jgi:hypothetical protein
VAAFDPRRPFTFATARAAGVTRARLEGPRYQRLLTGVYVSAAVPVTPWVRARAALLVAPPDAFVSHQTAAQLWGGVVPHVAEVHVGLPRHRRMVAKGVCAHRHPQPPPVVVHRGLPMTTPERTFLDLAGLLGLVDLVVLGDSLVHAGCTSPEALVAAASTHHGRGVRTARRAAALVRRGGESPMETRLRLLVVLAGLPEPETQHVVRSSESGRSYRLDLAWPFARLVLEYDGRHHVEREPQWQADLGRREDLEGDGWRFVVVIADDVFRTPDRTIDRVVQALRGTGVQARATSREWRDHFPGRTAA